MTQTNTLIKAVITPQLVVGNAICPVVICGPCVIESRDQIFRHAQAIKRVVEKVGLPLIFKSSYDKANRTSATSFRGVGLDAGLSILRSVKEEFDLPVITDVHSDREAQAAAQVVDVLQIPAFLCRQTDLLTAAGKTGKAILVKKGQFLAPEDMQYVIEKLNQVGNQNVMLCERGACFGYRELVVDYRSLEIMRSFGHPVIFDATHSVQVMGGAGGTSSGQRRFVPVLARAAAAVGIHGIFLECHEDPDRAPSDGPNMLTFDMLGAVLRDVKCIAELSLETRL